MTAAFDSLEKTVTKDATLHATAVYRVEGQHGEYGAFTGEGPDGNYCRITIDREKYGKWIDFYSHQILSEGLAVIPIFMGHSQKWSFSSVAAEKQATPALTPFEVDPLPVSTPHLAPKPQFYKFSSSLPEPSHYKLLDYATRHGLRLAVAARLLLIEKLECV